MRAKQKILIVDDRKENLIALRLVLSDIDADIIEANNGNDALTATLEHQFALAILDIMMPDMDGYELAAYLRGDEKTKLTPIIFVSAAHTDEHDVFKGYEAGGIDYIVKPIVPQILLGKVRLFLEMDRYREERKQAEQKMTYLAHTDALTGLANRTQLYERFNQDLKIAKRTDKHIMLMMLDLDKFKLINDTHGHLAGDMLLIECGQRIKNSLREADIVARLGGDEFAVMVNIDATEISEAEAVAEKIIERMQAPFILEDKEYSITISGGIALFPKNGRTIEVLMANADAALFRGKSEGRNQIQLFDESIHQLTIQARKLDKDLKIAIKENQFVLHFQPQFDTDGIIGAEALIRWEHPTRGLLYPESFLPALLKMDFREVELWTIKSGLQMAKAWQHEHKRKFYVAVNLSAPTLQDDMLAAYVNKQIEHFGLSHDSLEIEITEGMLVENVVETSKNLTLLSEMGVGIALDDFGVGYSSMVYLLKYPEISKLKIDREFVWEMEKSPRSLVILKSIIDLGHALDMRIVAEGVETQRQFDILSQHKCNIFQGYLVSPSTAAENWKNNESDWNNTITSLKK